MTKQSKPPYLRRYDLAKGKKEKASFELALIMWLLNEGLTPNSSKEESAELRKELRDYLTPIIDSSGAAATSIRRLLQRINSLRMMPEWILEKPAPGHAPKYSERFLTLDGEKFFVRMITPSPDGDGGRGFYYGIILRALINGTLGELHRCKQCNRVFRSEDRRRTEFCSRKHSKEWFDGHATERKQRSRKAKKEAAIESKKREQRQAGRELFARVTELLSKPSPTNQEIDFIKSVEPGLKPMPAEKNWDMLGKKIQNKFIRVASMR